MLKYKLPLYAIFLLIAILFFSTFSTIAEKDSTELSDNRPIIIIDAGHGGLPNTID